MAVALTQRAVATGRRRPRGGKAAGKGREKRVDARDWHEGSRGSCPAPPQAPILATLPPETVPAPLWHADATLPSGIGRRESRAGVPSYSTLPPETVTLAPLWHADATVPSGIGGRRRSASKESESGRSTCSTASTDGARLESTPHPMHSHFEPHHKLQGVSLEDLFCKVGPPPGLELSSQHAAPTRIPSPPASPPKFPAPLVPPACAAPWGAIGAARPPPMAAQMLSSAPGRRRQIVFDAPMPPPPPPRPPFFSSFFVAGVSAA